MKMKAIVKNAAICLCLAAALTSCGGNGESTAVTSESETVQTEPVVFPTDFKTDYKEPVAVTATVRCENSAEAGLLFGTERKWAYLGWFGYIITAGNGAVRLYRSDEIPILLESAQLAPGASCCRIRATLRDGYCAVYTDTGDGFSDVPDFIHEIGKKGYSIGTVSLSGGAGSVGEPEILPCGDAVGAKDVYVNPVLDGYADPDVLLYNGTYYLYGTGGYGYQVYTSKDLAEWTHAGTAVQPELWGITSDYWAPDVKLINGRFYMVVTCREHIGIAVADSPLGPFTELHESPLYESSIDGHLFADDDGKVYLYYVSWRAGHRYGLYGTELDGNMKPVPGTEKLLLYAEEEWEMQQSGVVEGPYMLKRNGIYYLTYSGSHYESRKYAVGYATSPSPLGVFERYAGNPILIGNKNISGTGHHCVVSSQDGSEMWIVYHCHHSTTQIHDRRICVDRIIFTGDGRLEALGPTTTPQLRQKATGQ